MGKKYKILFGPRLNGWGSSWQLWEQYKYMEHDEWVYSWHMCCQGSLDFVLEAAQKRVVKNKEVA